MFGIGSSESLLLVLPLAALLEIVLFWAAASLADVPPLSWTKRLFIALGVTFAWYAVAALGSFLRPEPLSLAPEARGPLLLTVVLLHVLAWALPAFLYGPLLRVSMFRGMLVSFYQLLLRDFLYVLLAALGMVVLAAVQLVSGPAGN